MNLFGKTIPPTCSYCKSGKKSGDGDQVLCRKQGIVSPLHSCRSFSYAPLKRIPRRGPALPQFDKKDFLL